MLFVERLYIANRIFPFTFGLEHHRWGQAISRIVLNAGFYSMMGFIVLDPNSRSQVVSVPVI